MFCAKEDTARALVHADRALYRAKDEGRNRVAAGGDEQMAAAMASALQSA